MAVRVPLTKAKEEKRRNQRLRAARGVSGVERLSGIAVTLRDFSTKALAIESRTPIRPSEPIEVEFRYGDQTFLLHGMPVRSDRIIGRTGTAAYLTAVEVRWSTPHERSQFETFLWSIPRATRQS